MVVKDLSRSAMPPQRSVGHPSKINRYCASDIGSYGGARSSRYEALGKFG
ncbi:unnamed protein product [Pocillopora meandrina]|uniref:Uncharacterized protein n=1 Tax=Pocillopora meandrina TaxID=46732 RepID=A0AAU9X2S4_9CNID|nr:unnamed protein product [Pocillopora meandrina]